MSDKAKFWDDVAEGYAKSKVRDERSYEKKLEITRTLFPENANVLEIACGTGTTALHLAPHAGRYLATDVSPKMLEIAREKASEQNVSNVTFEEQDVSSASLPKAEYDAVLAMSILHLLPDREAVFGKILDTLKPGGHFVSSTICLGSMAFFFPMIIGVMKLFGKAPKTVDSLTHDQLASAILSAGFIIEDHHKMSKEKVAFIVARKPA